MDQHRLTVLKDSFGSVPSRRDILRGLAGAGLGLGLGSLRLADAASAKNKKKGKKKSKTKDTQQHCAPNCAERTCGNDGCGGSCGACGISQVCHGGTCCVPESRSATCAGRCGTWTNNCGQRIACATCPTGQQCLSNGSCAIVCDDNADCTGACNGCSNASLEGSGTASWGSCYRSSGARARPIARLAPTAKTLAMVERALSSAVKRTLPPVRERHGRY